MDSLFLGRFGQSEFVGNDNSRKVFPLTQWNLFKVDTFDVKNLSTL